MGKIISMNKAFQKFSFKNGTVMQNRFMLAPLTNTQSHTDGSLSDEELHWLVKRAEGGFGAVMTCATNVQANGQGFAGQLGLFNDLHHDGHKRLTDSLRSLECISFVQLFHGGMRADSKITGEAPVCPSEVIKKGARALSLEEVYELRDNFIKSAVRAQQCGYDGIELHAAHGYIIAQFISAQINQRTDRYGGSLENRSRILFEMIDGVREACGENFLIGVRLSPERFGMQLSEMKIICDRLYQEDKIDMIDLSLWDCFKFPEEEAHKDQSLLEHFASMDKKNIKMTVAGNIRTAEDVQKIMEADVDFATIGRAAIIHHNFPKLVQNDSSFEQMSLPVTRDHLKAEGLSEPFINYLGRWPDFIK